MYFRVLGEITDVETIAHGSGIRELVRLRRRYGRSRAQVELVGGVVRVAELHWYEATGVGPREFKIKRYLD